MKPFVLFGNIYLHRLFALFKHKREKIRFTVYSQSIKTGIYFGCFLARTIYFACCISGSEYDVMMNICALFFIKKQVHNSRIFFKAQSRFTDILLSVHDSPTFFGKIPSGHSRSQIKTVLTLDPE